VNCADIAAAYRMTPLQQIDVKIGTGLNAASPTIYASLGYSLRFDRKKAG